MELWEIRQPPDFTSLRENSRWTSLPKHHCHVWRWWLRAWRQSWWHERVLAKTGWCTPDILWHIFPCILTVGLPLKAYHTIICIEKRLEDGIDSALYVFPSYPVLFLRCGSTGQLIVGQSLRMNPKMNSELVNTWGQLSYLVKRWLLSKHILFQWQINRQLNWLTLSVWSFLSV